MPGRFATPVLTVDPSKIHEVDTRNAESLHGMWMVFSKCADYMEEGRRLENLSWRLWTRETFCVDHALKRHFGMRERPLTGFDGSARPTTPDVPDLSSSVDSASSEYTAHDAQEESEEERFQNRAQTKRPFTVVDEDQSSDPVPPRGRERHITSSSLERMVCTIKERNYLEPSEASSSTSRTGSKRDDAPSMGPLNERMSPASTKSEPAGPKASCAKSSKSSHSPHLQTTTQSSRPSGRDKSVKSSRSHGKLDTEAKAEERAAQAERTSFSPYDFSFATVSREAQARSSTNLTSHRTAGSAGVPRRNFAFSGDGSHDNESAGVVKGFQPGRITSYRSLQSLAPPPKQMPRPAPLRAPQTTNAAPSALPPQMKKAQSKVDCADLPLRKSIILNNSNHNNTNNGNAQYGMDMHQNKMNVCATGGDNTLGKKKTTNMFTLGGSSADDDTDDEYDRPIEQPVLSRTSNSNLRQQVMPTTEESSRRSSTGENEKKISCPSDTLPVSRPPRDNVESGHPSEKAAATADTSLRKPAEQSLALPSATREEQPRLESSNKQPTAVESAVPSSNEEEEDISDISDVSISVDGESSEWEDSNEEEKEAADQEMFRRVDSRANLELTSRPSLLTMMMNQPVRMADLQRGRGEHGEGVQGPAYGNSSRNFHPQQRKMQHLAVAQHQQPRQQQQQQQHVSSNQNQTATKAKSTSDLRRMMEDAVNNENEDAIASSSEEEDVDDDDDEDDDGNGSLYMMQRHQQPPLPPPAAQQTQHAEQGHGRHPNQTGDGHHSSRPPIPHHPLGQRVMHMPMHPHHRPGHNIPPRQHKNYFGHAAVPLSPRTTRRNMLAAELTESLRRNLLWERQHT